MLVVEVAPVCFVLKVDDWLCPVCWGAQCSRVGFSVCVCVVFGSSRTVHLPILSRISVLSFCLLLFVCVPDALALFLTCSRVVHY